MLFSLCLVFSFLLFLYTRYLISRSRALTMTTFEVLTKFATAVCKIEGKKKSVDIAQVKEVLKIINMLLGGRLYPLIKEFYKEIR